MRWRRAAATASRWSCTAASPGRPSPSPPPQPRGCAGPAEAAALIEQPLAGARSGGVGEGNNLFAAGLPGIDTLGVRGGDIHSEREFAWPESFLERARLSALLLAKLADGTIDGPAIRRAMQPAGS